jgi:hypothetical protein
MKLRLPSKKFILSALSALIAVAILLTVAPAAYAEGDGPLTPIPGLGRVPNETLVRMHKTEISWYTDQEKLLKKANDLSVSFADLITWEETAKKNVTILQDALIVFNSELIACREIHNQAGVAIFNLIAFKANGDVWDRLVAGQSLLDGRDSLKDANFRLSQAMEDLRKSFVAWRHTRISGIPAPTPTP